MVSWTLTDSSEPACPKKMTQQDNNIPAHQLNTNKYDLRLPLEAKNLLKSSKEINTAIKRIAIHPQTDYKKSQIF